MRLTIEGIDHPLNEVDFVVACEGREIKFQIDFNRINPALLVGKKFVAELGKIGYYTSYSYREIFALRS